TAGASWHAISYTATPEEALALKDRYEKVRAVGKDGVEKQVVSRVVEVASLVPRDQERKLPQLKEIQHQLRNLPERGAPRPNLLENVPLVSGDHAPRLREELAGLMKQLQPRAQNGDPLLAELRRHLSLLQSELDNVPQAVAEERLRLFEKKMVGDLAED